MMVSGDTSFGAVRASMQLEAEQTVLHLSTAPIEILHRHAVGSTCAASIWKRRFPLSLVFAEARLSRTNASIRGCGVEMDAGSMRCTLGSSSELKGSHDVSLV